MKIIIFCISILLAYHHTTAQSISDTAQARQFSTLAYQQQSKGALKLSIQNFAQAATIYEQNSLWKKYLECQNQIARNCWRMNKLDSSMAITEAVLAHPKLEAKSLEQAEAFSNAGVVCDKRADFAKAIQYYQKCLAIRKVKLGDEHTETGKVYFNIGSCNSLQNKMSTALEYYNNALRILKKNLGEEHPMLITVYTSFQPPCMALNKHEEAVAYLNKALKIAEKVYPPGHEAIAGIKNNIGLIKLKSNIYHGEGLSEAEAELLKDIQSKGENNPEMLVKYIDIANVYADIGKYDLAEKYYLKAKDLALSLYGEKHTAVYRAYDGLSNLMEIQNKDSLALYYAHHSMLALLPTLSSDTPIDSIPDFNTVPTLSIIYLENAFFGKAICLDQLVDEKEEYKPVYINHLMVGKVLVDRAIRELENVGDQINVLENYHKYALRKVWVYKAMKAQKQGEKLLEGLIVDMDNSKSMLLKIALTSNQAVEFGGVPDTIRKKDAALKSRIQQLEEEIVFAKKQKLIEKQQELELQLFKLKEEQRAVVKKMEKEFPEYYSIKYKKEEISVKDIQEKLLDDSTMIIAYFQTVKFLYVYTITKDKVDVHLTEVPNGVYDKFKELRLSLTNLAYVKKNNASAFDLYCKNAYFFYEVYLKKYIPSHIRNLILMPDKELNRLPFEIFLTEMPKEGVNNFRNLKYLINKYNIRYAYSAQLLIEAKAKQEKMPNNSSQILAFAAMYNSQKNDKGLHSLMQPLPGVLKEVGALQEKFNGQFLMGEAATESNFKNADFKQFGVVHLAMHGVLDKKNPMNSCLAFTKNPLEINKEDDLLHAYELTNMAISARLVVLSACETGDGVYDKIDGVASIGRSFMYAGVPSLIMTLWQVNDFSTAKIMGEFYNQLGAGKTKSEALRQAKFKYLDLVKNSDPVLSHPFFWAAFICLGDDSNIEIGTQYSLLPFGIGGGVLVLIIGLFFLRKRLKKKELVA